MNEEIRVISRVISFNKDSVDEKKIENGGVYYIGNHIKKRILESQDENDSEIILNYPVVYVHEWRDDKDIIHYYIGETIDLARRTSEHWQRGTIGSNSWQTKWLKAVKEGKARSFYFSSCRMNKSLSLDIEHCLIILLTAENLKEEDSKNENGRGNPQGDYSNKNDLCKHLLEIWRVLEREDFWEEWKKHKLDCTHHIYNSPLSKGAQMIKPLYKTLTLTKDLLDISEKDRESKWKKVLKGTKGSNNLEPWLFLNYPVVYMHTWLAKEKVKVKTKDGVKTVDNTVVNTYVGETNNLVRRTLEHYYNNEQLHLELVDGEWKDNNGWKGKKDSWREAVKNGNAVMLIFAHPEFNKSVTLDIENRLIQYTIITETSTNGRTNEQRDYYGKDKMYELFTSIVDDIIVQEFCKNNRNNYIDTWNGKKEIIENQLNRFTTVKNIQEDAVFVAAPFLKPSSGENGQAEEIPKIKKDVMDALDQNKKLLLAVRGSAGTGKTVLAAKLFFDLLTTELGENKKNVDCRFIVNHEALFNLYSIMKARWGLGKEGQTNRKRLIWKPTEYLNSFNHNSKKYRGEICKPDVVIVDEAHLLLDKGDQGDPEGKQLPRLLDLVKVIVIMYDPFQTTLPRRIKLSCNFLSNLCNEKNYEFKEYELGIQMRMKCSDDTKKWIGYLSGMEQNGKLPSIYGSKKSGDGYVLFTDERGYEIRIYDDSEKLSEAIELKKPFSCLLATYEWDNDPSSKTVLGKFSWHNKDEDKNNLRSWTEKPKRGEVGAIHDIQGFDLRYAGVILGECVQYNNKKMEFKKEGKEGQKHKGGLPEDDAKEVTRLISNEVGVLLTRGMDGLFIYAQNEDLRTAMRNSLKDKSDS